jgi:hypothetical protein
VATQPSFLQLVKQKIVKFRIKFSIFFSWTILFHYLRLMAVATE